VFVNIYQYLIKFVSQTTMLLSCASSMGRHSWSAMQQHQWTEINKRHHLWLSTGTQVRVGLLPSIPAGTAMTLRSGEAIQERPLSSREVKTW